MVRKTTQQQARDEEPRPDPRQYHADAPRRPTLSGSEYIAVADMTRPTPTRNVNVGTKSRNTNEKRPLTTIAIAVANPFKMLSAYLMTAATMRPPAAWTNTSTPT